MSRLFNEGDHVVFRENGTGTPVCGVVKGFAHGVELEYIIEIPHINNTGRDCVTAGENEISEPRKRLRVAKDIEIKREEKE